MSGPDRRGRRAVLAGLGGLACAVGLAGCSESGNSVTAVPSEEIGGAATPTATDVPEATATPTDRPTSESMASSTPTATPMEARVPPRGSLSLVRTDVAVANDDGYTEATPRVVLDNVGDVTYELLELRYDLHYTPLGRSDSRRQIASGYGIEEFDGESGFRPGDRRAISGEVRYLRDGRADRSTDAERFDVAFAFRRVRYR